MIVDQVKPAILKGTAMRFDLSKGQGIKRPSIFGADMNDHLILIASFLNRRNLCGNRCHDCHNVPFLRALSQFFLEVLNDVLEFLEVFRGGFE